MGIFQLTLTEAARNFQYDYIFIDAFFLTIWLMWVLHRKRKTALIFGAVISFLVYLIDAVIWWNLPAGPNYPGEFIREYTIDGQRVPHNLSFSYLHLLKFGADFMMTISYSLFAFTWMMIMFEGWRSDEKEKKKDMIVFTILIFTFWMLIPMLSIILPIWDIPVSTVRYMDTQFSAQIITVAIGYILMFILYGTNKFHSKDLKTIGFIFFMGCYQGFVMEFPIWLFGIRPTGVYFLIYEIIILINQGTPYLFILWDKIFPYIKNKKQNSEINKAIR